jgi:hypothetical protein
MMIESSHGVMYQQRVILRMVETLLDLLTGPKNRHIRAVIQEQRISLFDVVEDEIKNGQLPEYLHPDNIPRRIWRDRVLTPDLIKWLLNVHRYFDEMYSDKLPR